MGKDPLKTGRTFIDIVRLRVEDKTGHWSNLDSWEFLFNLEFFFLLHIIHLVWACSSFNCSKICISVLEVNDPLAVSNAAHQTNMEFSTHSDAEKRYFTDKESKYGKMLLLSENKSFSTRELFFSVLEYWSSEASKNKNSFEFLQSYFNYRGPNSILEWMYSLLIDSIPRSHNVHFENIYRDSIFYFEKMRFDHPSQSRSPSSLNATN